MASSLPQPSSFLKLPIDSERLRVVCLHWGRFRDSMHVVVVLQRVGKKSVNLRSPRAARARVTRM